MAKKRTPENGRDLARGVLRRVLGEQAYLTLVLDAEFGRARLSDRERRLATALCYGVCRHLTRLDRALTGASANGKVKVKGHVRAALRVAAYQLLFLERVPAHAAVDDAVEAARVIAGPKVAAFVNSVLRRLAEQGEPALPEPGDGERALEYARVAHSMPDWLCARLAQIHGIGQEFLAAVAGLNQRAQLAIRVNRRRIRPDELAEILAREMPGCQITRVPDAPDALLLDRFGDPARSPSFVQGLWTVQDIGAQLVVDLATADLVGDEAIEPVEILDACAGVGGKTTYLAERFGSRATIHAVDISTRKLEMCAQTAERLGLSAHIRTIDADLSRPLDADLSRPLGPFKGPERYHIAILDAPCTGLGVLRRHPEAKWRIHEADIAAMADIQRALLDQVCALVRPGGVFVYSVCTFTREEGPDQITGFLERHPEFALEAPVAVAGGQTGAAVIETWPHRHQADAFFAARLRKSTE